MISHVSVSFPSGRLFMVVNRIGSQVFASLKRSSNPPRWAEYLLNLLLDHSNYDKIGDLEERFQTEMVPKFGLRRANFWYWKQAVFSAGAFLWPRVVKLATLTGLAKAAYNLYRRFVS